MGFEKEGLLKWASSSQTLRVQTSHSQPFSWPLTNRSNSWMQFAKYVHVQHYGVRAERATESLTLEWGGLWKIDSETLLEPEWTDYNKSNISWLLGLKKTQKTLYLELLTIWTWLTCLWFRQVKMLLQFFQERSDKSSSTFWSELVLLLFEGRDVTFTEQSRSCIWRLETEGVET